MSKKNIDIKVVEHKKIDDSYNNYLVLSFKGVNHVIMNTLRRTIMELVPTYAFDKSDIEIKKLSTIPQSYCSQSSTKYNIDFAISLSIL